MPHVSPKHPASLCRHGTALTPGETHRFLLGLCLGLEWQAVHYMLWVMNPTGMETVTLTSWMFYFLFHPCLNCFCWQGLPFLSLNTYPLLGFVSRSWCLPMLLLLLSQLVKTAPRQVLPVPNWSVTTWHSLRIVNFDFISSGTVSIEWLPWPNCLASSDRCLLHCFTEKGVQMPA